MRKIEIINKEVTKFKLTLTKDHVRIKIPIGQILDEAMKKKLLKIADKHPNPEFTLRGTVESNKIILTKQDRTISFNYDLNDL